MALGDKIGDHTVGDLNQFVHSWLDDFDRRVRDLILGHSIEITIKVKRKDPDGQGA